MPLSILNAVAFEVVHESVEEEPAVIDVGFAVSVQAGGGGVELIPTNAVHVATWPVGLVTVPIKVVVAFTECELMEPPIAGETAPTPLSIANVPPFVVVHEREVNEPAVTDVGFAVSVQVGTPGGGEVTATVAVQVVEPPAPVAVPV